VLDAAPSNKDGALWRHACVLYLRQIEIFGANRAYLHIETPLLQEGFLSKITKFSQGNNVLYAPASTTNGVLSRDTFVSST
jgi:hypothetical protein